MNIQFGNIEEAIIIIIIYNSELFTIFIFIVFFYI